MALDHSRLRLENKFLENKSGRIFLRSTGLLYKFLPTNLRVCKPTFYTFYTSHLRWNSTFYHTDLGQNTAFHNFSMFRTINRGLLAKPFKKFPKSPIRPAGSHFQCELSVWSSVWMNFNRDTLQHSNEFIIIIFLLFNGFSYNDV